MKLKRTMSLLLAICLLVGILPMTNFQTASAAQRQPTALTVTDYSSWATDENGLQYKLESSTLKVLFRSQEELEKGMEFYKTKQAQIGGKNVTYYAVWFCVPDGASVELGGTVTIPETEVPFTIRAHRAWSDYDDFNIESYGYVGGWRYTGQVDVLGKLSLADGTKVVSNAKLPEANRLTKGAVAKTGSTGAVTWSEPDASSIRAKIFLQANQDEMTGLEFTVNNDCALGVYYADNFWYDYAASRSYFTVGGPRSTSDVKQAWYNKLDVKTGGWFDSTYGVQAVESVSMPNLMGENTRVEMFKEHWPQTLMLPDNCVFKLHTSSITGDVVNNNSFKSYVYGWYKVPVYNHEARVSISGGVTNNIGQLSVYGTCEKDLVNRGTSVDLTGTVRGNVIDSGTGRSDTYRYVYEDGHESLGYSPRPTVQINGDVWGNVTVNPCTNPLTPDSVSGRYTHKYDVNYVFVTGYVGASQYFGNDSQYDFSGVNRDIVGGHVTIGEHSIGKIGGAVYMVDNAGYATLCGEVVQAISHGPSLTLSSGTIDGYYHEDWRHKAGYVDASTGTLTIEGYIFEAGQLPQAEKGFTSKACVFSYDPDGGSTFHVESGQKINDSGSIFWLPVVNDGVFNCQQASVYFSSSSGGSRTFSTTFNKSLENNGDASFQKIVANDLFTNNGTIRALKNSELHLGLLNTSVITELSGTLVTDDNPNGASDVGYLGSNDGVLINQRGATIVNLGLASNWSAVRTNKTGYGVINRGVVSNLDGTYVDVYGDNAKAAFYTAPGSVTMNIGSNAYNVTGMDEYSAVIPFDEYDYYWDDEEDWEEEDYEYFDNLYEVGSGVSDNEFMTNGGYKTSASWTIDWSFVPNYQDLASSNSNTSRALPNKSSYAYTDARFTDTWADPRFSKFVRESGQAYTLFDKLYAQVFYFSSPAYDMYDFGSYYPYYWDIRTDEEHATKTTYDSSDKNKENPLYWRSVNTGMFVGKDPVYEIPIMMADLETEHILNGGTKSDYGGIWNYHLSDLKQSLGLCDSRNSSNNYAKRTAITPRSVWLASRNATVDPFNLVKSATGKTVSLASDLETVCWEIPKSGGATMFNAYYLSHTNADWDYVGFEPVGFRYKQDGHYEMRNGRRVWVDEVNELLPIDGDSSYTLSPTEKDTNALAYPGNKVFISEIKVDTAEPYNWFVTKTDADGNEYLGTKRASDVYRGGIILNRVWYNNFYNPIGRVTPDYLGDHTNQPPEVLEVGADYVIVNSHDWPRDYENRAGIRHEFSIDKENWVFEPVKQVKIGVATTWRDADLSVSYRGQKDNPDGFRISGLTPDTDYSVYSRAGASLTNQHVSPSDPSPATAFHTKKVAEAPAAPVFVSRTATSITCEAIDGQIYSADNGKTWFAGKDGTVTITKLTKGTEYNIITKTLAHDDLGESPASEPLVAYTKGDPNESLVGPTVLSKTNSTITCAPREGYEFGFSKTADKKNITWKQSEVLTGLTTNTQYYIYVRKAETDEHLAGQISEPVACKTLATQSNPGAISVTGKTDTSFTVNVLSTQEYSLDGTKWQTFGDERQHTFTGFEAGQTVTLRTRKLPTATATTSNPTSLNIKMLTKPAAPAAPTFIRATNHTIRVQYASGQEFSINNGATWQTGVTFYDLMADQEYEIITRVKATTTGANNANGNVASEPSKALTASTLADAPLIPSVPQIKSYDDTSVTVIVPDGYEVRRGTGSWTTNGMFTGLIPNTDYSFYQRIKATDMSVASESSDATVVHTKVSSANVAVPETPEIIDRDSDMLRVSKIDSLEYAIRKSGEETELTYQNLGTFEELESGTEYVIYVRTKETDTAMSSQPVFVIGATLNAIPDAPAAPEMAYRSAYDIKVNVGENEEVSIDGGKTWQDSGEFHDLKPATEYEIIKRTKSTENGDFADATRAPASKVSEPLKVSTMAEPVVKPAAPSLVSKTDNTIIIDLPEGSEASIDGGKTWQTSGEFVGLGSNQDYEIVTRIAATDNTIAGPVSEALSVKTKKSVAEVVAPEVGPEMQSRTDDSIMLSLVPGMEYKIVGTDEWQTSPTFDHLEPGKEYTFVSRWAETDDARESNESPEAKFSTKSIPAAPNTPDLKYVSSTEIEIYTKTGLEYMIISGDYSSKWTTDGLFANLAPDKEYTIVARKTETENEAESELSQALKVRTKAEAIYEIAAPVLLDKSDTSLTISLPDGWESQIDDGEWTETSVFEDLKPDSEHTIKIRIKATDSTMPSMESKPLVAVTKKPSKENVVPGVPEVETRTDVSIKIKSEEGLEYSIDGGQTWNKTGEFNGLVPGENYEIIARTSENEEFMPSAPSRVLKVSTKNVFKPEEEPKPELGADDVIMTSGTSFRVNVDEKYEVSIDGGETWSMDRDFGNLKPGETYDIVIRTHETEDNMPGPMSEVLHVKVSNKPAAVEKPEVFDKTDVSITIAVKPGDELSIDGGRTWTDRDTFEGLTPDTEYQIIERKKATADTVAGESSEALTVRTKKTGPEWDESIEFAEPTVGGTYIRSEAVDGYEFSIDGGKTWVETPEFEDLKYSTEYGIMARKAGTDDTMPGEAREIFNVRTKARPAPSNPGGDDDGDYKDAQGDGEYIVEPWLFGDGKTVRPYDSITRAEASALFYRVLGVGNDDVQISFKDVSPDAWYYKVVTAMGSSGVLSGYPDEMFHPNDKMTRAQFAMVLTRYKNTIKGESSERVLTDIDGHWAEAAIKKAVSNGWIFGDPSGKFRPDAPVTRAEAVAMINRVTGRRSIEIDESMKTGLKLWADLSDPKVWFYNDILEAGVAHEESVVSGVCTWTKVSEVKPDLNETVENTLNSIIALLP